VDGELVMLGASLGLDTEGLVLLGSDAEDPATEQADAAVASSMVTGSGSQSSSSKSFELVGQPASDAHAADEADKVVGSLLVASGLAEASEVPSSSAACSTSEPASRGPAQPELVCQETPGPRFRVAQGGYVFSNENRLLGRISSWGTSVSVKCQAHGSSCNLAKGRRKFTDDELFEWLGRASEIAVPEIATTSELRAAAARHKALFRG